AVQLDHRPDLDPGRRQPLTLGLHVLGVDRGDSALLSERLALAERDFGRAAVERDPPLVVDVGLFEAEGAGVERTPPLEIANAVPDSHSIRAGSSSSSLTDWRNPAAGAPSTARWTGTTSRCGAATATPMFAVGCSRIASSAHCAFTSGWRMSAAAQTFVRTSVTVSFGPPSFSRRRATSVFARVMSAEDWSWKT